MEKLIELADVCNETNGCSFTVSRNKYKVWKVTIVNQQKGFEDVDINVSIDRAIEWVKSQRKELDNEVIV